MLSTPKRRLAQNLVLGVVADTSDSAMNRLLLKNRPERSEAMSKPPGDVIEHKVVSSREQFLTLNPKP